MSLQIPTVKSSLNSIDEERFFRKRPVFISNKIENHYEADCDRPYYKVRNTEQISENKYEQSAYNQTKDVKNEKSM